jgi:two-component system, OmpR family, sensor kinase
MIRKPRLHSLRNKLALVFFLITAAAFSVIYFYVVPGREEALQGRQLHDLQVVAKQARDRFTSIAKLDTNVRKQIPLRVRSAADDTSARVTLLGWDPTVAGPRFTPIFDSREATVEVPVSPALSTKAFRSRRSQAAISGFEGEDVGQVAQPIKAHRRVRWVVLYTRDLDDVEQAVSFVRNRVLIATIAALLLAMTGGYLVARRLARRVRRLEEAAKSVAVGRFVEPLPVDSRDELGQLTQAFNDMQDQLRQLDVARKEFIATASHELRTPIFSLGGFVELLQDEDLDEDTRREFIETMSDQVARLQKLSVDLLDLSRLDAGSVDLQTEPVDLSELARLVIEEFMPALAEHGTELEVDVPASGVRARCDRGRVAQIMRILLDNAIRHTPEGTQVLVRADRHDGTAALTVTDYGPGMADAVQAKAFDRFYTGDAARGAGLGLAIASELAGRMGGRLSLVSRPGNTTFMLELPLSRETSEEPLVGAGVLQ